MDVGKLWMAATGCGQPEVSRQKRHRTVAPRASVERGVPEAGDAFGGPDTEMQNAPPVTRRGILCRTFDVGGDLLSHTLASAVPSALEGLASGFGMGPGVPHSATTTDNTNNQTNPHNTGDGSNTHPPTGNTGGGLVVCSGSHSGCEQQKCCGQALGLLVPVDSTPHRASIPGLSTPSSLGGLNHARWWETSSWNELPA